MVKLKFLLATVDGFGLVFSLHSCFLDIMVKI